MNVCLFHYRAVFVTGFTIGFITVFLLEYAKLIFKTSRNYKYDLSESLDSVENWSKYSEKYKQWCQYHNIHISKVDLDNYVYGKEVTNNNKYNQVKLEADWLKSRVSITCIVFVEKLKYAVAINNTWGQHCNKLIFFSQHVHNLKLPIINLKMKLSSSWQFLCESMSYIWKHRKEMQLQWIIFIKDDTIVIPENLRYLLATLNFNKPYYLGHASVFWGLPYNVAQAGYVISLEVLQRLMKIFDTSEKCSAGGKYWKKEDYYLGKHLASLNIYPMDTRDSDQRGTFHTLPLNVLLWSGAKLQNYYTRALYPPASNFCCSNRTVTFNIGEPDKMRMISYILYQLRVFEGGIYGNKLASTPFPENEVWRMALQEEFNFTKLEDISNERYFQIWKTKYSEPEKFIASRFRIFPESEN